MISMVLLVVTFAVVGFESDLAIAQSPIAIAASTCAMAGLMLMAFALVRLVGLAESLQSGLGLFGSTLAIIGTLLGIGGAWAKVFVLPGLAGMDGTAQDAAAEGIRLVTAGYIVSFLILAAGWLITGVSLLRSRDVPRWAAVFVIVGAVICIVPLPSRFFVIALALTAIEARVFSKPDRELTRV